MLRRSSVVATRWRRDMFSSTVADALDSRSDSNPGGREGFLLLPQFELRGRCGLLDIWCVPAPERRPL